jgi:hypothetical protein
MMVKELQWEIDNGYFLQCLLQVYRRKFGHLLIIGDVY